MLTAIAFKIDSSVLNCKSFTKEVSSVLEHVYAARNGSLVTYALCVKNSLPCVSRRLQRIRGVNWITDFRLCEFEVMLSFTYWMLKHGLFLLLWKPMRWHGTGSSEGRTLCMSPVGNCAHFMERAEAAICARTSSAMGHYSLVFTISNLNTWPVTACAHDTWHFGSVYLACKFEWQHCVWLASPSFVPLYNLLCIRLND